MPIHTQYILNVGHRLDYDQRLVVQVGTVVGFFAKVSRDFQYYDRLQNIRFSIYFPYNQPKGLYNTSQPYITDRNIPGRLIEMATLVAEETGEYKFGLRADDGDRKLFDEDPYLIVI